MAETANVKKERPAAAGRAHKQSFMQLVGNQVLRVVVASTALLVLGIAFVAVLVLIQARRDETRPVDAIIVLPEAYNHPETMTRAVDLYRRGYSQQLIIIGEEGATLRAALNELGLPTTALLGNDTSTVDPWQAIADAARQHSAATVLLVSERANMLRDLKIARDLGLKAYAAPLPGPNPDFPDALRASMRYWAYVLVGVRV
jgi:uncharacterized SAM-binding protein YcdF (DUF218 family)